MSIHYKLPDNLDSEINAFSELLQKYKIGEVMKAELKAHRVPFGVYEQREPDTYMMRIRCSAGIITPLQLEKISELSSQWGGDSIHLTTRQELQIHQVKLDTIVKMIEKLKEIGLATRGGGGNTVRNIISPENAGIDQGEVFDVTPHVLFLTNKLIAESDSWTLPRKLKISFSGSDEDHGNATLADLGFIATIKNGEKGFKVYVAGGMGAKSSAGHLFIDFLKEEDIYYVARAIKLLFWKHGNRKNKHAARLRFLWKNLGEDEFRKLFQEEYDSLKAQNESPFLSAEISENIIAPDMPIKEIADIVDFELWRKRFVLNQKQDTAVSIIVPVELGFIKNEAAKALAECLKPFGENVLRLTKEQNFLIRNINPTYLPNIYTVLKENFSEFNRPLVLDKIVSCAGASTCQLGICHSRAAAKNTIQRLASSKIDLDSLKDFKIRISGCPNACGHHPIADLGFIGKAARRNNVLYPSYNIVSGSVVKEGKTQLAERIGEVSARDLPAFIQKSLQLFIQKANQYKNFKDYLIQEGESVTQISDQFSPIPTMDEDKNYYFDWGKNELFSLSGRGGGECSAGLFDLIEVDAQNIKNEKKKNNELKSDEDAGVLTKRMKNLSAIVFYSARMLLIARGVDGAKEEDVYKNFKKHFIATGLVDGSFENIIDAAKNNDSNKILESEEKIFALSERMQFLYDHMDNAFNFDTKVDNIQSKENEEKPHGESTQDQKISLSKDFRAVGCPMNFVKTKLALSQINKGELLEILLDDGPPIENVPRSVLEEGHAIVKQEKDDNHWIVRIKKS